MPRACLGSLLGTLAAVASLVVRAQPQPDVLSYEARVEPRLETRSVDGSVMIRLSAAGPAWLVLDAGDLTIDAVREEGAALVFEKRDGQLLVSLPERGETVIREISVDYHGAPVRGMAFVPEARQVSTAFVTSGWLPSVAAPGERATLDLTLVLPAGLTVVANGRLLEESPLADGRIASRWSLDQPMPAYLFGFAAGPFREATERAGDVELRYLGPSRLSDAELRRVFAETRSMLEFFAGKAGVPYPYPTYSQALLRNGSGQEMASFAVFGERYGDGVLAEPANVWLGAHEVAHQWWGNAVTNESWNHFWLNEGLGTFMTAAYLEHRFGRAEYLRQIDAAKAKYEALLVAGRDKPLVFDDWSSPSRDDRSLVYDKGAYVVHLLREELGDDAFWAGIAHYTQRHWGRSVTTRDFETAMEQASGRDLSPFFARWVYLE
jgi:aminopeptidase N